MMKRIWVKLLLVIFTFWLFVSSYFYFQHNITVWKYSINNHYEINNVKIDITEIYVKNYEENQNLLEKRSSLYDLIIKLPSNLVTPIFQLNYFYSKPFLISKKYGTIGLKGKFISDTFRDERSIEIFTSNLEIEIIDDIDVHYSNAGGTMHEDGSNIVDFKSEGSHFPLEKLNSKLKIYIKNKQQNNTQQYTIEPKFIKKVYGFFDGKPREFE